MPFPHSRNIAIALAVSALVAACGKPDFEASMAAAKDHLSRNEADKAIIELKNALQNDPGQGEARFLLGKLLLEREDAAGALLEFRRAEEAGYPEDEVLPLIAQAHLFAGEPRKVIFLLARADRMRSPQAIAAFRTHVAEAHARVGETDRAEEALGQALAAAPGYAPAEVLKARALASQGALAEASARVEKVLSAEPTQTEALMLRANLAYERGDTASAQADLRRVLVVRPNHLGAHAGLLAPLIDKGDFAGAQAQLSALAKLRPAHPQTIYFQARLAERQGDLVLADERVKQLVKVAAETPQVLQLAGFVAFRRGELEQAEQRFAKLLQLRPEDAQAQRMLARVALQRGDAARALAALQPLLSRPTVDADTLTLAGEAHVQAGSYKLAEDLLARAVKQQPADIASKTTLAKARLARGDTGGLAQLESIAATDPGDAADLALIAAHLNRRNADAALQAVDRLAAKKPASAVPLNLRGQILAARGDLAGARASFDRALAVEKQHFPTLQALARLDLLEGKDAAARARMADALKADPKNAQALLALAAIDERARRPRAEVVALIARAVAASPSDPGLRVRLVDAHIASNDSKAALVSAQEATAALPNDLVVLDALGRAQLAAGETQQALRSFQKLSTSLPKAAEPWLGLARTQLASGEPAAALSSARRVLALDADHLEAHRLAAVALLSSGKAGEATDLAVGLARRKPALAEADTLVGDVERARGRLREAAAAYQAALRKRPGDSLAGIRAHGALLESGNTGQAGTLAASWLTGHPKDVAFRVHLASLAVAARDYPRAQALLDEALQLEPGNPPALNNLAWLRVTTGQAGAVELAVRANAVAPNQPVFMDTLALALAADRKFELAIALQKQALELGRNDPHIRLGLARIYVQAGEKAAARTELETLQRLGDKFSQQAEVQALAARL